MVDFHSHVLPGVDDGASNIEESIQILKMLKEQGVNTVIATPHYYDSADDLESFLEKRNNSYKALSEAINRQSLKLPDIILGAEVYLSPDVVFDKDFKKLCIGNTNNVLVELPNGYWFDWVYLAVDEIVEKLRLTPIIAHLERYASSWPFDMKNFERLLKMDVLIQMNADSVSSRYLHSAVKKLLRGNYVHLIGSDSHNTADRKPCIDLAYNKIIKKYGKQQWDIMQSNAKALLSGYKINKRNNSVASGRRWFSLNHTVQENKN